MHMVFVFSQSISQDIERAQRRCLKLLYPALSYNQALNKSGLERLDSRHDAITQKMFQEIKDPKHPLHYLLPPVKVSNSLNGFTAHISIPYHIHAKVLVVDEIQPIQHIKEVLDSFRLDLLLLLLLVLLLVCVCVCFFFKFRECNVV